MSENKKFIATLALVALAGIGTIAGGLASTLGGNTKLEMNDEDNME